MPSIRYCRDDRPRGEILNTHKLTEDQVKEIREKWKNGQYNYSSLGREYGVFGTTIKSIIKGWSWRHVS